MNLGWDVALDMIDYTGVTAEANAASTRQRPSLLREERSSREVRLVADDILAFFDIRALEVEDELGISDDRFSILVVEAGGGSLEGDFDAVELRRGATLALPALLTARVRAGEAPLRVIRCLGPDPGHRGGDV